MNLQDYRLKSNRNDFETHLKYISLIADLSNDLKVTSVTNPVLSKVEVQKLDQKILLAKLTKESLDQEYKIVFMDGDYSLSAVLWLPIKVYYLIYHLLCIIDCIEIGKVSSLNTGHYACIGNFTCKLENSNFQFNNFILNSVFSDSILTFKTQSGEHLKYGVSDDVIYMLIMKNIANAKIEEYKRKGGLTLRKDKIKIDKFKSNLKVSIFDYFHLMRLRMNYRNMNFLENIPANDTKLYFDKYYIASDNIYKCLSDYINSLIRKCP